MNRVFDKMQMADLKDYQSIPFWSWNAKLEPEELIRQIHWMKECGIGGFIMHARSGLKTEYLSDEWMECIKVCVNEAEKIGMNAWVYDENGWPSGFVGGKLLEKEENRDQYILHTIGKYDPEANVSYLISEECIRRVTDGNADGTYLNLTIHVAASTVDILNPKVVEQFIQLTHEQYKNHFGSDFSKKIKGFFTDEPQYHRWNTPYTPMIASYFQDKYGEDILDSLGLLFVEKKGYRTFRYRYWKGLQELMLHNFAEKVYKWCDDNGVKLTGHYVEEVSLGYQIMCCGGCMPFYEYEHIPGIDWLGAGSDNELSPKQIGSVAAQLGKKHVLTETFGCCGWNISPTDLRRVAGFQYVNGVNAMCQHLIPYAEYGNRKHDYPAHYSPINPWVRDEFRKFNDYFTRLGYLLAESKETVNVAMLHPIRSAYFDYKRKHEAGAFGLSELNGKLMQACRTLSSANIAYHFIDETLFEKYGFVEGGKIGCGKCTYEYLVLPELYTMDTVTERLLKQYIAEGGKVLLLGAAPEFKEGEPYSYDYLRSNCSLEDIISAQPYCIVNTNTEIYSTRRVIDNKVFLYVINASKTEEYEQTFCMGEKFKSFISVDLNTFETKNVPRTITLKPGEAVVLFPDQNLVRAEKEVYAYDMKFYNAEVDFEENYLPVDFVCYSEDGVHYSEKWPCAALFQKLLEEHKEGEIYFKYEFEVRKKPEKIYLRVEDMQALTITFNGVSLTDMIPSGIEKQVISYDISSYVQEGINEYCVKVNWYESPDVYYALFGDNVTESLKNCIVYDSELEPIYIVGIFGVYPADGYREHKDCRYVSAEGFYIGEVPQRVSDPVVEGFPFMAGAITLKQRVHFNNENILLKVKGFYQVATVIINGKEAGNLLFDKELNISEYVRSGENEVKVRFVLGNFNLMGPQHNVELCEDFVEPFNFELYKTWIGTKSPYYHDWYDLRKLYED